MAEGQNILAENERFRQMLVINIDERLERINGSIRPVDKDSIDKFIADTKRTKGREFEYGQEKRDFYVHYNILQFLNQGSGLSGAGISVTAKRHRGFNGLEYSKETRKVFKALFFGVEEIRYLTNDAESRSLNLPAVQRWMGDNVILEEYRTNGRLDRPEQLGPALIELRRSLVFKEFKFAVNGAEHRIGGPSHVVMNNESTVVMIESYMINGRYRTDVPVPYCSLWSDYTVHKITESVTLNTGSEIPTMGLVTKEYYGDGHIRNEDFRKEALSGELVLHRVGGAAVTIYNNDGTVNEESYFLNGVPSNEVMPVSVCYRIDGSVENFVMPDTVGGETPLYTSGFDAGSSYDDLPLTNDIGEILESYAGDEGIVRKMRPIALEAASGNVAEEAAANVDQIPAAAGSAFADSVQVAQTGSDIEDVSQAVSSLSVGSDSSSAPACSAQSNFSNSVLIWSLPREILEMVKSRLDTSDLESIAATSKNSRIFEREEKMRSALGTMSRYRVTMEDLEQSLRDMNLKVTDGNKIYWLDKLLFINRYEGVSARETQIERIDGLYRLLKHGRLFESGTEEEITYEMYNIAHGDGYIAHNEHGPALIERYLNGVLRREAYYINGRLHRNPLDGAAETYYRDTGRIWSTRYCLEGRIVFANGAASKQLWGNDGSIAEIIYLYPNNRIRYSCKRYVFETHPQDFYTETKEYYENGKLCRVKRRKNGVLHCRYMPAVIEWFSNGKLRRTDYYIAGQPRRINRQVETHQEHQFYDSDA